MQINILRDYSVFCNYIKDNHFCAIGSINYIRWFRLSDACIYTYKYFNSLHDNDRKIKFKLKQIGL